ncbi:MAG: hypothetical protein MR465_06105 [Bacilli bacterium]|nr:hypothetical protein [Bacilli bacterium]
MKKILMTCLMLVIVSVMVGCSKTNNSLKERKCAQLDKIYEELDYKEYSLSNWNLIINYIEECKLKIKLCNEKIKLIKYMMKPLQKYTK